MQQLAIASSPGLTTFAKSASRAELLATLPAKEREELLQELGDLTALEFDWRFWARVNQLEPEGDWGNWLILAGRGFGKTRTGAEWVKMVMCGETPTSPGRYQHLALIAETAADARDVMVGDGKPPSDPTAGSGILQVHPPEFCPKYEPSKRRLTWPNGGIATIYNATEPEQLRGPQHDAAWCDELAKWRYANDCWDQLQFGLRTGSSPRIVITTTPKPIKLLKEIIGDPDTVITRGSTFENASNLAPRFIKTVVRKYEGTRLGRQELEAEVLDDVPGALWSRTLIEELRVKPNTTPTLTRIVVAIDPSASSGEEANECGIVCAGLGIDGHGYILEDASKVRPPGGKDGWAAEAVALLKAKGGDRIVAEVNNGGDMVEATIRVIDPNVPFRAVHASRGKVRRAEPVSALYEQGKVHHVGAFPQLEDQMCSFTSDFDPKTAGYSPDRMDALVWALTELMLQEGEMAHAADERDILVDPFDIPRHWPRVFALDVSRTRVAAVWGAIDRAADTVWLYGEYAARRTDIAVHSAAISDRCRSIPELPAWVPGVFDHRARKRGAEEGERIVTRFLDLSLDIFTVEAEPEALAHEVSTRLGARRLRVFRTLTEWLSEYRNYRRDADGALAQENDGLMQATGLVCLSGVHIAVTDRVLDREAEREHADGTRDKVTGY